jgi:sugar transferase (PEP-CTERM/EpsH1 system associated)
MEPRRPRIQHVVDDLDLGGLQGRLLDLVEETGDRFEHAVCCIRRAGILEERFARLGVPVTVLDKGPGHDWSIWLRHARQCRAWRPDIVHARNWGAVEAVIGAFFARVPVVIFSEHGRDKPIVPRRRRWVLRALSPLVDVFVAVAGPLGDWLRDDVAIPPSKISTIYNGVDVKRFAPRADRAQLRRALGYGTSERIVGSVGRLQAIKNYGGLIAAFALLSQRRGEARLLIVGDGPERAAIEEEIARRKLGERVCLLGQQVHVEDFLSVMDVFVQPSRSEGMPASVLEAMSVGLPVVATRVGGLAEVVVDGETGRLVPAGDLTALADAMERYCADGVLCAEHGAAGRRRAHEQFSRQRMVTGYCELYERLLMRRDALSVGHGASERS